MLLVGNGVSDIDHHSILPSSLHPSRNLPQTWWHCRAHSHILLIKILCTHGADDLGRWSYQHSSLATTADHTFVTACTPCKPRLTSPGIITHMLNNNPSSTSRDSTDHPKAGIGDLRSFFKLMIQSPTHSIILSGDFTKSWEVIHQVFPLYALVSNTFSDRDVLPKLSYFRI